MLPFVLGCAICGAAEQGLPANGAEVAFEGRRRLTLDLRAAGFETTDGSSLHAVELRAEPGAEAAVGERTMVGVAVPILHRTLTTPVPLLASPSAPKSRADDTLLGDIELRASFAAYRAVGRHLTFDGGAKLPTAPIEHDSVGRLVTPDLQPGCSSVVPFVRGTYGVSGSLLSAWVSAGLFMPVSVREAPHPGDSVRASATLQLQPVSWFATRLGVHGRYDSTAEIAGEAIPRSGGAQLHVAPELVFAPTSDVVFALGASFPFVQAMRAYRETSPVLLASAGVDF